MKFTTIISAAALSVGIATAAAANTWTQAADQNTAVMIYQLDQYYASGCMAGDGYSCQMQQGLYNDAMVIENAAYSCLAANDQSACYLFQNGANAVAQSYYAAQGQASAGYVGTPYYGGYDSSPAGHMDRMQQIHNWGETMLANGRASSAALDASHERFMSTLRD